MLLNDTPDNLIKKIYEILQESNHTNNTELLETADSYLKQLKKAIKVQKIIEEEDVCLQVVKLLSIPQYEQRSDEWFKQRENKLTSSDVDSVLGNNKYSSYDEVLFKKCGIRKPFVGNEATRHGQKYEDEAIELYCKKYNKKTFNFGLLPHPKIDFLAGSPDDITYDGIVIEVKCPLRRKIVLGEIPIHYQAQIRMNMEICSLKKGVFIEYKPAIMCDDGKCILNIVHFERDPLWIQNVYPTLEKFWNEVLHYRKIGIKHHPEYERFYKLANPSPKLKDIKRSCSINTSGFIYSSEESDSEPETNK